MRDTIVIMKAAGQGVNQAIYQGHPLKVLRELKVKSRLEKGSTKLTTWTIQSRTAQFRERK